MAQYMEMPKVYYLSISHSAPPSPIEVSPGGRIRRMALLVLALPPRTGSPLGPAALPVVPVVARWEIGASRVETGSGE
ncbi:predicted protein [Chaetomium globosum CBS 148.51]|uniref:Uncharacterized protein n=1 Tax=Chaetomium globosum (strain ATCC 6205 / CBS 148.51 / DSM 1962 / NBRC 6347 / NRRL 1970) TaxID=306901 RepID=Q2H8R2_CHAGB|nr:uncharacterized protein CHGG_03392 [Chaetomium globosum CBS 148.51]EAQ91457.1 predicted protein [Chaetomium globosum CBS 148.51]